jgi:hypothetical protein
MFPLSSIPCDAHNALKIAREHCVLKEEENKRNIEEGRNKSSVRSATVVLPLLTLLHF